MDSKGINELLERYRKGHCTADEKKALEEWFDARAEKGDWEWSQPEEIITKQRIKRNIDQKLFERKSLWPVIRIAAMLFITLGSLLIFRNDIRDWADPVVILEKTALEGERIKISLPDGSMVWLNGGSKLTYPNRFSKASRQVNLVEGEAYFDISHDPSHPFIVSSKNINTQVLGTAFNIKAYRYLSNLQVAVTRGKVCVSNSAGTRSAVLLPNQQVTVDRQTGAMIQRTVDAQTVISWQNGDLSFNNDRLADVCAVLSKKYRLQFHFRQAEIKDYRVTAGFISKEKISDILSILANANGLSYEQQDRIITFKKRSK